MPYTPKTWENKPSTASPINATNLNHMEGGIKTNDDNIVDAQNAILTLQGEMLQAQGDISALETLVDSIFPVDTESGNPAVITDAFGGSVKALSVAFAPIQSGSGTPSPSNVRPISGLTEANVVRTGKNLLPQLCDAGTKASVTLTKNSDGSYTMSGSPSANNQFQSVAKLKLLPGTYIWRASADGTSDIGSDANGYAYLVGVNGSGTWIRSYGGTSTLTVTVESEVALGFGWYNATSLNITFYPMIRPSSITNATFEAYNDETYTIDLDGTRYGGTVDFKTGVMTVTHAIVDLGTKDWNGASSVGRANSVVAISGAVNPSTNANKADMICNKYEVLPYYVDGQQGHDANSTLNSMAIFVSNSNTVFIYDSDLANMTGAQVKAALNGTIVCYKLATPITVQLTPEEVTLLRLNNVLTTNGSDISVSYSADVQAYIEKKIAEGSNNNRSVDNSSLTKGGSSEETEEVKEEEKEEIEEPKKEETR